MQKRFLTCKEVGEVLQVNASTVYRMAKDGRLPSFIEGSIVRIPVERFEAWLQERTTKERGA